MDGLRRSSVPLEGAHLLDVGCGSGYFVNRMVEFGAASGTGIDLMADRVDEARQRYPRHRFVCGNGAELPFGDGEFGVVTQFTCLSSVLDGDLRLAMCEEMWRVVRPGGAIVSYDMRAPGRGTARLRRLAKRLRPVDAGGTPTAPISKAELHRAFPTGEIQYETAGLAFRLCGVAGWSHTAASVLSLVPALREHAICVVTKPAGG